MNINWINKIINIIIENKEWLFSGIGIVFIAGVIKYIANMKNKIQSSTINISNDLNMYFKDDIDKEINNKNESISFISSDEYNIYENVDRFIRIYQEHNIQVNQIYKFVDKKFDLKLSDFKSKASILEILSDDLLDYTAETFRIQRDWLDGKTDKIYWTKGYYKNVHSIIKLIGDLYKEYGHQLCVYAFKSAELNADLELNTKGNHVILLIQVPIKKINNTTIYYYIPIRDIWYWEYWRTRFQIKSIFWACVELNASMIYGYYTDVDTAENLAFGNLFPYEIVSNIKYSTLWYPEDYSGNLGPFYNKEVGEIPQIKEYIKQQMYHETIKEYKRYVLE